VMRWDTFSAVFLSSFLDGGVKALGAKQSDGPEIPRKTGRGRIVSSVTRSVIFDTLAIKNILVFSISKKDSTEPNCEDFCFELL